MVIQYPHILKSTSVNAGTIDDNGDYVPGTGNTETEQPCRAESSDGNGYLNMPDGKRTDYSWIVYLPQDAARVLTGTKAVVMDGLETILTDTVKRFSRGQLNCRIWL